MPCLGLFPAQDVLTFHLENLLNVTKPDAPFSDVWQTFAFDYMQKSSVLISCPTLWLIQKEVLAEM